MSETPAKFCTEHPIRIRTVIFRLSLVAAATAAYVMLVRWNELPIGWATLWLSPAIVTLACFAILSTWFRFDRARVAALSGACGTATAAIAIGGVFVFAVVNGLGPLLAEWPQAAAFLVIALGLGALYATVVTVLCLIGAWSYDGLRAHFAQPRNRWLHIAPWKVVVGLMLLSLCCYSYAYIKREKPRLLERHAEFAVAQSNGMVVEAYAIYSPTYRSQHTFEEFLDEFRDDPRLSVGAVRVYPWGVGHVFEGSAPRFDLWSGVSCKWVRVDGEWYYTGESYQLLD